MPYRDDDSSTSDCSSVSSVEEYPLARKVPDRTQSMFTSPTFVSKPNSVTESDSDDSDDSSDEDEAPRKSKAPPVRKAPARAASMPAATKAKSSASAAYLDETTLLMSKQAADMASALKMSLDAASVHSRDSEVEPIIDFTAECDDFKVIDMQPSIKKDKKKKKDEGTRISVRDLGKLSLEAKKQERMERVRHRLEAEEDRKQKEIYEAKMKQLEANKADMTEAGRRKRCWEWYSRTGMISKEKFIEKIPYLPPAAALEEADVELLPWNARGTMVNVAKLNSMLLSS